MHSDVAISVNAVTKAYRLFGHPGDRIKQFLSLGVKRYHSEFTALSDITFDIKKGETVGIIGRNGSGKSTLLQVICGILKPSSGTVDVTGRVSALLELGAGFNPEFTGRENVFFQGALMGFTRTQMEGRFDEIAAFADIGEFIDQPVRTYSSGMFVRLAFTVATSTDPDILIVDEALGVGDMAFQHKSQRRMQQFTDAGGTLLVVSHDQTTIAALCKRCLLLDRSHMLKNGPTTEVFDYYHALISSKKDDQVRITALDADKFQVTSGTGEATVMSIFLTDEEGREVQALEVGTLVALKILVKVLHPIPRLVLGFSIRDRFGQVVYGTNTVSYGREIENPQSNDVYHFIFTFFANIGVGTYSISTALVSTNDRFTNNYECKDLAYFFEVRNVTQPNFGGNAWLNPRLTIESQ